MAVAVTRYVARNSSILSGEPTIAATRIPVRAIVGLWRLGIPPEEIPTQYPQLTLAQVFDALSFYLDNQDEVDGWLTDKSWPLKLQRLLLQGFQGLDSVFLSDGHARGSILGKDLALKALCCKPFSV